MMGRWLSRVIGVVALAAAAGLGGSVRGADPSVELKFSDFYINDFSIEFSEKLKSLAGKPIAVRGYIAPPLKANADFLVMTREPVILCPYCDTDAAWPNDILVVYMHDERIELGTRVKVTGTLDVGSKTDKDTGFVSLIRLVNAEIIR